MERGCHDRCRWRIETARAERIRKQFSRQAIGRRQSPRFAYQLGQLDPPPERQSVLRHGHDMNALIEQGGADKESLWEGPADTPQCWRDRPLAEFAELQRGEAYMGRM